MAKTSVSDDCIDMVTPWNEYLSAKYKRSFAYHTVRNRLPVTVTQVIDHLSRSKEVLVQKYGEESREEIKQIIGYLSKLKNEMQTNKPLTHFEAANEVDLSGWNEFLSSTEESIGRPMLWFADVWLHIECYLYRRIRESFALTKHLNQYDPFRHQKEEAFTGSLQAITAVGTYLLKLTKSDAKIDTEQCLLQFLKVLHLFNQPCRNSGYITINFFKCNFSQQLSLWGNRCDLSISGGKDIAQVENPLDMISQLDDLILVNDLQKVWSLLNSTSSGPKVIDIIFDNSGYELFSDLCLAHLLVKLGLADEIRFHAKRVPWFISDVMEHDFHWLIQEMGNQASAPCLSELSAMWKGFLSSGTWTFAAESFWTLPYSYDAMERIDPELHNSFVGSKLLIFKGDLNYRKLVGDVCWPHTEKFSVALRGFGPAPLVTLRTIKADVAVGLQPGQAEKVAQNDTDWLLTGKYAVVSCFS